MSHLDTRFTVSSFQTEQRDEEGKALVRWNVYEDTIAIYETGSEQDARGYADALTANLRRIAG